MALILGIETTKKATMYCRESQREARVSKKAPHVHSKQKSTVELSRDSKFHME